MKKLIFIFILFIGNYTVFSQDILPLSVADINGRWIKVNEDAESSEDAGGGDYTYIFRENGTFHCGEIHEGVILFNIAGKYVLEGNLIKVVYFDFSQSKPSTPKPKHITFNVLSVSYDRLDILVQDYDYEYKIVLKRQTN